MERTSEKHKDHLISVTVKELISYPVQGQDIDFERGETTGSDILNVWCDTCFDDVSDLYECDGMHVIPIA